MSYQQRIASIAPDADLLAGLAEATLTAANHARQEIDRCLCDLLIGDIRREPRSDTQAGLIAELLRSLKAVAHHKRTEAALENAAEEFDAIAADLKVIVDESEAPRYRITTYGRTPAVQVYADNEVVSPNEVLTTLGPIVSILRQTGECTSTETLLP